jgi:hypothetical protein
LIRIVRERPVYENDYGQLFDDDVEFTASAARGRYVRWVWKAPYSVAVLAVVDGRPVVVRNYRHAARAWVLEVVKGFGSVDLSPSDVAWNELRQETGLESDHLVSLGPVTVDPGFTNQTMYLFVALDCRPGIATPEPYESILEAIALDLAAGRTARQFGVTDAVSLLLIDQAQARGLL